MVIIYLLSLLIILFAVAGLLNDIERRMQERLDEMSPSRREFTKALLLCAGALAVTPYLLLIIGQYA